VAGEAGVIYYQETGGFFCFCVFGCFVVIWGRQPGFYIDYLLFTIGYWILKAIFYQHFGGRERL
jgi:hypothetical protein